MRRHKSVPTMMKKIALLLLTAVTVHITASAQPTGGNIRVENPGVYYDADSVHVSFDVHISPHAAGRRGYFVFAPVLTNGRYSASMPAVIVYGKGIKNSRQRREWAAGYAMDYPGAVHAANGQTLRYRAAVKWQHWMNGSALRVEGVSARCLRYDRQPELILAEELWLRDTVRIIYVPEPVKPKTTAEVLAETFPFIEPESAYNPDEPFRVYDEDDGNSLTIYYPVNTYHIQPDHMDNALSLTNLCAAIQVLVNALDSDLSFIVVAGFASPEGRLEYNNRLAFERAVSVKEYIMRETGFSDEEILVFNGSIDWQGLKWMVAKSSLPEKEEIIDLIDRTPIAADSSRPSRLDALMQLNEGRTYQTLLRDFFPFLRKGAFIKVYYKNN